MARWLTLQLLFLACAGASFVAMSASLVDTVASIKPSVVGVGTFQYTARPQSNFLGTGFVVGDGQHVVTNDHVVPYFVDEQHKQFVAIFTGYGREAKAVEVVVVARDSLHDLALLRLKGVKLKPFKLAADQIAAEGEEIAFTGYPIGMVIGLFPVTHRGIISSITPVIEPVYNSKQLTVERIERLRNPYMVYQLDATAYPGNSGSPVYYPSTGQLVGVVNKVFIKETKEMVIQKPSGITYAMPSRYVRKLLEDNGVTP